MLAPLNSTKGFILLLTLSGKPSSYVESRRIPLVNAMSKKYSVVYAYALQDALVYLSTYGIAGVIVADGGIAKGEMKVPKNEFRAFFAAFGLAWKRGSYHRQEFYLNILNALGSSHLLDASYIMKALQVDGITEYMAIYDSTGPGKSSVQLLAIPLRSAPIAVTSVGTGRLGYIGDVSYEQESMNVYLAMLNILDSGTCIDASDPLGIATVAARPFHNSHSQPITMIVVVALDCQIAHQLDALQSNLEVVIVSKGSEVLQSLAPGESTVGVYLWKNKTLYPALVEFAKAGGKIVCGGMFPASLTPRAAATFFEAFGISWTIGGTHVGYYELSNPDLLPERFKMKSRNIMDAAAHVPAVYVALVPHDLLGSEDEEPLDASVLHVKVGEGKGELETTTVLLAMFDLLRYQPVFAPHPKSRSKKFAILVSPPGLSPLEVEHENSYLIGKVEEKLELVRGLSAERVADLIDSPDLTAVIVSSASITPAMAYLNSKLVDFTSKAGGTLVLLDSFAQDMGLHASRDFFLCNWGLDWTNGSFQRHRGECPSQRDERTGERWRKKWLPKAPRWEGALTLTSTRSEDMVYVPARWEGNGCPGFGWFDGERGVYFEGPVLYAAGFVGGWKDEEETVRVVVTMIVSGF
ncbi:hypothetical protein FA13DRAFT_1732906 [Coprinellus micaceus]|uniref:Uncharacterized protein n=1 Tax=Coprinellus micaceus TaxID=71717 RepID=A0A4Y7TD34_COPMI|nr:hypothetical protein FA13DRAFT_1732906 [Coprinellus micaceus]